MIISTWLLVGLPTNRYKYVLTFVKALHSCVTANVGMVIQQTQLVLSSSPTTQSGGLGHV